ncbi:hypothetical protein ACR720_04475 [Sphingomonas parapaucimobilis]|uniref:hypothetical protein n=1 Tax=Sphingomonas parapaucimobilis TaxID=28213 RepID=UPI0039EADA8F
MATAACLPIAADRVGPCVRTIFFIGLDLTGVVLAMEVRLNPETPGAPAIGLGMAASADAEGLRVMDVSSVDGVPSSRVVIRINETTMKDATKVPYGGELGSASTLYYDLIGIFGQDKRRLCYGTLTALPTVYGMDAAPSNRPSSYGSGQAANATWSSARLTFGTDDVLVTIDGADLLGAQVGRAEDAADSANAAAARAGQLITGIEQMHLSPVSIRSGWIAPRINAQTGRVLEGKRTYGDYWQSGVTRMSLDVTTQSVLPYPLRQRSGWLYARVNARSGRVAGGTRRDGSPYVAGAVTSVGEANLNPALHAHMFKERTPVRPTRSNMVAAIEQSFGVTTHAAGYPWQRLGRLVGARYLRSQPGGVGVTLQFRRRLPVRMGGVRYLGTWSPAAAGAQSLNRVGYLSNTTDYDFLNALPAAGGYNEGDYLVVRPIGGGTLNTSAGTAYPGDLLVIKNGAWVLQQAPAGTAQPGQVYAADWWEVSAAGTFDGVSYAIGDRIVMHGGVYYHRYRRGRPEIGEMFNRGEIDASGAAPATPRAGDAWQVTVAGAIGGAAVGVDDWLLHDGTGFYSAASSPITTTVANRPFLIQLTGDTDEYEVRRAEKSQPFPVALRAPAQASPRIETNAVYALGDSMMHFLRYRLLQTIADRVIDVEGFDSAGAEEIVSAFEHYVLQGDPFAGRSVVAWFGQNGEAMWQEAIDAHLRMYELLAPFDRYYLPITPAGRREMTFNGARLVSTWHEPMMLNVDTSNPLVMLQQQVAHLFAGRFLDARVTVCAAVAANATAFAGPDVQYPGMTEAQATAAYGVIPLSIYLRIADRGLDPATAAFKGYRGDAALPSGGADGDYYIRSAATAGTYVGNLIARVAGAWTEIGIGNRNDVVHFGGPNGDVANTALSTAIRSFINANQW